MGINVPVETVVICVIPVEKLNKLYNNIIIIIFDIFLFYLVHKAVVLLYFISEITLVPTNSFSPQSDDHMISIPDPNTLTLFMI